MHQDFSAVRGHCPPEKPFAIRYSPFAVALAGQGSRAPDSFIFGQAEA
jgi:hypothetical protein